MFTVNEFRGFDCGAANKFLSQLAQVANLSEAFEIRDAYNAKHIKINDAAVYDFATVVDSSGSWAVIGFGRYGNGSRIMSIRPAISVCKGDEVLFTGSLNDAENFKAA